MIDRLDIWIEDAASLAATWLLGTMLVLAGVMLVAMASAILVAVALLLVRAVVFVI
jgi:hypothetical protein